MYYHAYIKYVTFFLLIFAVGLFGCDNPVDHGDDDHADDHADAEGLVLLVDGEEIVRVEDAQVTDTLWVPLGATTSEIVVEFLDHDGDRIHKEDFDDDFGLGWQIADTDVVTLTQEATWSFVLEGSKADTTAIRVQLLHLGHPDFTTPDIPVVVR